MSTAQALPEIRHSSPDVSASSARVLALLATLFALRVAAQALQRWLAVPFLPPFSAFQGSDLPYSILLVVQLLILAVMLRITWRVNAGTLQRSARLGRILAYAGALYVVVMLARLAIGIAVPDAPHWFHSPISIAFHFVLAMFVLTLAAYHRQRRPAEHSSPVAP